MIKKRSGVALLITLFFIIAITAAVGVSLMNLRKSGEELHQARFLLQTGAIVDDVLSLMNQADKLGVVADAESLNIFLMSAGFIPLQLKELLVKIEITSAMGRININTLQSSNEFQLALAKYMIRFNVQDAAYMNDLLIDCMSGYRENYRTDIFDKMPELYREGIVSKRHFDKIMDYYIQERHDNGVTKLPWEQLIRFDDANATAIDANYITPALWQMLIPGLEKDRAINLSSGETTYKSLQDIDISPEDRTALSKFNLSFYQPTVHVNIEIIENNSSAKVTFDYDLTAKRVNILKWGFKSKAKAFFVDVDSPACTLEEPVNIILSPSMYWVKRVKLPVKYLREVKNLMPSLFEDNLPAGKYSFSTYKDGDSFLIFAYNDKEVLDLIANKRIASANINNIYLAQSEFDTIKEPIRIDEKSILSLQNGVIVKLPEALSKEAKALDLSEHTFSKHSIHLTRFNQIADKRSQIIFASILGFLILIFAAEWIITKAKVSTIIAKESEVFTEHNLPATSFQNEAILAKLNTVFERQTRIRSIISSVLAVELAAGVQMQHVILDKNKMVIELKASSKETGEKSLSDIAKQYKNTSSRYENGIYTMEIQL